MELLLKSFSSIAVISSLLCTLKHNETAPLASVHLVHMSVIFLF